MAVRIQITPRRRRRAPLELPEVTPVLVDETALLEAVERTLELIDEALVGS